MTETLFPLLLATLAFVGGHFALASRKARAALIGRFGEGPYLGLFSAMAIVTFVLMCLGFVHAPILIVWAGGEWAWYLSLALMPVASILFVAALLGPNPTMVRGARALAAEDPTRGIYRITRHPLLSAIALWALLHMIATGDGAALIFFGGFFVLAVGGMAHIDARYAARGDERWARFAAATSSVPFLAALQGRARISLGEIGLWRIILGLLVYAGLMFGHEWVIGLDVVPR